MTLLSRPAFTDMSTADLRVIGSVGLAHFVSHFKRDDPAAAVRDRARGLRVVALQALHGTPLRLAKR